MKIAVCVKAVPDAATGRRLDPATGRLDRSGEPALSDFDTHPVEEALRLREAAGERRGRGRLDGPGEDDGRAAQGARDGRRPGGARSRTRHSRAPTSVVTSRALAAALEREAPDLVLFGQQSADGDGACLWAAVAERLRRPAISQVAELTVAGGSGHRQAPDRVSATRRSGRRCPRSSRSRTAINEPRYPSLKGIMGAKIEAAGGALGGRGRRSRRAPDGRARARPAAGAGRAPQARGRRRRRRGDRRVPRREAAARDEDARLPRAPRRRASRRRARRPLEGGAARR